MYKKILVMLLAVALAMSALSIGNAVAATTTNNIEFTLEGYAESYDPVTSMLSSVPVSAVFDGNIQDQDGTYYLEPLTGIITIDGEEHQIQIKQPKQSEPVYYDGIIETVVLDDCNYFQIELQNWMIFSEVNIEGHKYIGDLNWNQVHSFVMWDCEPSENFDGESDLSFNGIIDGKMMHFSLNGDFPVIS